MTTIAIGSFIKHDKLVDLGSGEVVAVNDGTIRIRFASGDRSFSWDRAAPHLVVTREAPVLPTPVATKAKGARKSKAKAKV